MARHDRRRPCRLEAPHGGRARRGPVGGVLAVALPVGGDVAGVADGQAVDVGGVAQDVDDLERGGLLPLDPVLVDAVDQADRVVDRQLAGQREAVVEVALDLQQLGAVHQRLGQLAGGDLPLWDQDGADQAGAGGVRGGAGAGVAGGGADDRLGALLDGLGDGHRHPAVLERPGRVGALDLEPDVAAGALGQLRRVHERRPSLVERDKRLDRQALAVAPEAHQWITRAAPRSAPRSPAGHAAASGGSPARRSARRPRGSATPAPGA